MKLTKTKKILLLWTTLAILTTSIITPVVLLNKDEKDEKNDVEKLFKFLKAKTTQEKIIELPSSASGKIIANNQNKIIEKIKTLIGKANLKDVKIEVLMQNDINISTAPQNIIIKLTKDEVSKEIKDFSVKKKNPIDEDIESIKEILDAKSGNDLIITLPSDSSGNIIQNATNKNAIIKKLRTLIDPSNAGGIPNHPSLKGTSIEISMNVDAPISTTLQDIIVSISKTNGTILTTTKTFQVKRDFTNIELADKDITSIKNILDAKSGNDLIITLPSASTGNIIQNATNKNAIIKKLRTLIDPSNAGGIPNHPSLKGTSIEISMNVDAPISTTLQDIIVSISKTNGTILTTTKTFQVKRDFTADEDIEAIMKIFRTKERSNDSGLHIILPSSANGSIINNPTIKNAIERKARELIDSSNTNGDPNHISLRGTKITLTRVISSNDLISNIEPRVIVITISKPGGTSVNFSGFVVRKL